MKKSIILLLCIVIVNLTSSCMNVKKNEGDDMTYDSGIYYYKDWDSMDTTYSGEVVPTKECAIEIATAIFNSMSKSEEMNAYKVSSVFYDTEDEFWVVTFADYYDEENDMYILGGGVSIAIQKNDGRVLKIWYGE